MRGVVLIFLKAVMQSLVSHLSLFKICVVGKAVSFPSHTDSSSVVAVRYTSQLLSLDPWVPLFSPRPRVRL